MPGGICSIITFIVLTYYMAVTMLTHSLSVSYVTTSSTTLLTAESATFNVSTDKLQVFSMLYSTNDTITANMDAYVGGVYLQEIFDASTKKQTLNYIQAVQCAGIN